MRKSDLKRFVRNEIKEVLTEGLRSRKRRSLQEMAKLGGKDGKLRLMLVDLYNKNPEKYAKSQDEVYASKFIHDAYADNDIFDYLEDKDEELHQNQMNGFLKNMQGGKGMGLAQRGKPSTTGPGGKALTKKEKMAARRAAIRNKARGEGEE